MPLADGPVASTPHKPKADDRRDHRWPIDDSPGSLLWSRAIRRHPADISRHAEAPRRNTGDAG